MHYSLIDYFLTSPSLVSECQSVKILIDGDNPSDHLVISCNINLTISSAFCDGTRRYGVPAPFPDEDIFFFRFSTMYGL